MGAPESLAADVASALHRLKIPHMLVGAAALAARGVTRGSHDIDFMTTDESVLDLDWKSELPGNAEIQILRGDFDDPLKGTVRIFREDASPVDVVVGKWKWQRAAIERSERLDLGLFSAPVPGVGDLVLLKVDAGSFLDQRDAAQLIEFHGDDVIRRIDEVIDEFPGGLQKAWSELRRNLREED